MEQTIEKVVITKLVPCVCARDGEYWGHGDGHDLPTCVAASQPTSTAAIRDIDGGA